MKKYLPILFFIMAFTLFLVGQIVTDKIEFKLPDKAISHYNQAFLETELIDLMENRRILLRETIGKSKFVILNFWATWCSPCISEFPSLIELKSKISDSNLKIFAINLNQNEKLSKIKKVVSKMGVNFPVIIDNAMGNIDISIKFRVKSVPFTLIFKDGELIDIISGPKKYNTKVMLDSFQ